MPDDEGLEEVVGAARLLRTADGRALHYRRLAPRTRAAARGPVVLWEAGMGTPGLVWSPLHAAVAERAPSILYDRAGLGRSDRDPEPRTLARLADDLARLIDGATNGPVVLVGHSWGGPVARVAAALRPGRVAGMVLVDPSDEHLDLPVARGGRRRMLQRAMGSLAMRSRLRAAARGSYPLPAPVARAVRAQALGRDAERAEAAEFAHFRSGLQELRSTPPDLDGIPVTLISGTRPARSARARTRREAMVAAHERTAAEHPPIRFVRAERSGHLVPLTEPELVLAEVGRLLDRLADRR
ncbi:alpha/beta fold hydrolase [Gulosibacter sp. 10]|uniref:alpha/beta fold hydrolase n=1 Tax=Gulosibacter sp. 10 TaxID=1255570 RepID=UPI00097EABA7|nr:alpha/beta hydrolase [Gulosibacter sp. 10]SJM70717.1 Possible hydrolase or acyltransferase RutD in novel pyrimidine catabolism pathway [Gulosibacter sp. 10]